LNRAVALTQLFSAQKNKVSFLRTFSELKTDKDLSHDTLAEKVLQSVKVSREMTQDNDK
jgi:hypothetical protein